MILIHNQFTLEIQQKRLSSESIRKSSSYWGVSTVQVGVSLLGMQFQNSMNSSKQRGFTIVELLIVIAILVLLTTLLIPTLGKAMRAARSAEDRTQAKGIYSAMLVHAASNDGNLPRPSLIKDSFEPDVTLDTTANLMSVMIGRNFFDSNYVISPVEANPNVQDMNQDYLKYDFDSIDGENVFWDDQFNADVSTASAANIVHNSYAHQGLVGDRIRQKWHSGAGTSDIIISNRGPREGMVGTALDTTSYTLKFHADTKTWSGVIVTGDGSARLVGSVIPEGIAYQPVNGLPLGPDNIFSADWNDITTVNAPEGMASGDNWLVIYDTFVNENELIPVWD